AKLRGQMRAELAVMRQRVQKNMIYVTHDQIEAMTLADRIVVMHGGYIQQEGTPAELFKSPANKFVAGFLGSPPMNFLEATLSEEAGTVFASGDGFKLALPKERAGVLRQTNGKITLGIRPSDLDYAPEAADSDALDLKVTVSEYIGAQSVLLCACGTAQVTVELKSETPIALGETLRFAVRPGTIHLFDTTSEKALLRPQKSAIGRTSTC
ncbi:MAG: TOBE domain-containing protein, partial [Pseudomonadota bacterium]